MGLNESMNYPKWKKVSSALILGLMILFLFYTAALDRIPGNNSSYTESLSSPSGEVFLFRNLRQTLPSDQKRLRGVAFAFNDVPEEGYLQVNVYDEDCLIYGGRIDFSTAETDQYTEMYLNLPSSAGRAWYMTLEVQDTEDAAAVYVRNTDGSGPESLSMNVDGKEIPGKQLLCQFEYRTAPSAGQKAAYIVPRLLLFIPVLGIILYFERILSITDRLFSFRFLTLLFELAAGRALAPYVYHGNRTVILACIAVISAAAGFFAPQAYRLTRKCCAAPSSGILFVLFCVYTGFAAVGSNTLILPLGEYADMRKLLVFALAVLWTFPVNMAAFGLFRFYISHAQTEGKRLTKKAFLLTVLPLIWIPALITLYAYNPVISSTDTMTAVHDARNLSTASGYWIPALYTLAIRAGLNFVDNVCVIAIEQLLFWSFVTVKILLYAREKGIKDGILFAFALFIGCNPANVLLINTGWKDIPYTCSLVWAVLNLIKLTVDGEKYAGRLSFHLEFAASLACTYMLRKNGTAPFLVIIMLLLVFFRGYRKRYLTVLLSIVFIFIVEVPVCRTFGIDMSPVYKDQRVYSAFAVDSIGMYLSEAEMNEKTLNFVAQSSGKFNNDDYRPTYYNFYSLSHFDSHVGAGDFILLAGDAIIKNPAAFMKVSLAHNDIVWNVFPGDGRVNKEINFRGEVKSPHWLEIASERRENDLTRLLDRYYKRTRTNALYEVIYYRCGLYSWLSLFALLLAVFAGRTKEGLMIHAPVFAQILGLWVTSGYGGEFRFYWPQNVICLLLLLTQPVICRMKGYRPRT